MDAADVDVLVLGPGSDLQAACGYDAHASERMTLLVVPRAGDPVMVVPELEEAAAATGAPGIPLRTFGESDDSALLAAELIGHHLGSGAIAVGDQLWSQFLLALQGHLPEAVWTRGSAVTRALRMVKDAAGVAGLRAAAAAIDAVHRQIPDLLVAGRTEREVGRDIDAAMRAAGHDAVDFVIVAGGPNGASPHHGISDRPLQAGEGIVIDIGGPVSGWFSDCTRNYVIGTPDEAYLTAFEVLQAAQRAAVEHVRPGVTAESVDAVARQHIEAAGYGAAFIHRTGHGIGLDVHEEPYITAGNDLILEPGMTFSVEPGIYLAGRFGMRIEDIVAVTDTGVERLNCTSTDLVSVEAGRS
ncbi:M24 family metallopeptidase [Euzebya tangerina]|uniref:M24 family metallopeptidase n=1 Tax=Euzebya tangerina TaxID=591198 RepID=UPI000E30E8D9